MVLGNVLGSIVLISIFFPYFLVAIAVIAIGYVRRSCTAMGMPYPALKRPSPTPL